MIPPEQMLSASSLIRHSLPHFPVAIKNSPEAGLYRSILILPVFLLYHLEVDTFLFFTGHCGYSSGYSNVRAWNLGREDFLLFA